jgi:hypothetical protein
MHTLVGSPEPAPQPIAVNWVDAPGTFNPAVGMTAWTNWCPRCGLASGTHFIGCARLAGRPRSEEE